MAKTVLRALTLTALLSLTGGCSWLSDLTAGEENVDPPKPLEEFTPTLSMTRLWTAQGGAVGEFDVPLRLAIAGSRVYVAGSSGEVRALDASTGARIWEANLDETLVGGVAHGEGLVVVSTRSAQVVALSEADGSEVWRRRLSGQANAPVAISGNRVVARTADGHLFGLDVADGAEVWNFERRLPALTLRGTGRPLITRGLAIAGFDNGRLVVLGANDGQAVWERTVTTPRGRSELERMVDIDADPKLLGDKVYVVAFQGRVMEINLSDGSVNWARDMSSHAGLDVGPRFVAVSDSSGDLWLLDRQSGQPLWKQDALQGRAPTGPAVVGSHLVVADFEGYLHVFSVETGRTVAREQVDSGGVAVAPVVDNGVVYVLGRGGVVSAYRPGA
ncbi:MAG: outer membrane protein assembly factor BamB [Gammaproteobacteria bacterium]